MLIIACFGSPAGATGQVCAYTVTASFGLLCPYQRGATLCLPKNPLTGNCDRELRCIGGAGFFCNAFLAPRGGAPVLRCPFGSRKPVALRCTAQPNPFHTATAAPAKPTTTPSAPIAPTATPTATAVPSAAQTPSSSPTSTLTATATPSATTAAATSTPTLGATSTATASPSFTAPAATATATLAAATATSTPPATATSTPLATATSTATAGLPTATPTISELTCSLASSGSGIQIHIAALPVPLSFPIGGAIGIGATPADGGGASTATCSVLEINPINIPSIGFVCISPASGCPLGMRDCDGGSPLGVAVSSDGNLGACTGNAECATACATQCGGAAGVLQSGCTGFCSDGAEGACTADADCMAAPNAGACNGPDPIGARAGVCQCTCVDTAAHGASEAGDLQCHLGAGLVVETGAPCGGGDVLIEVGSTCIPVTTQRASSTISDANFTPGATLPAGANVNDLQGAPVACATLDAGGISGLTGVGAVNFFGSALGDLAVGLNATCQ